MYKFIFIRLSCLMLCGLALNQSALSQKKVERRSSVSLCSRDEGLEIIQQQIAMTRTFNDTVQRINILVQAADLVWPYLQDKARGTFAEAFELAKQHRKQKRHESSKGIAPVGPETDQRYRVISAIAKRDAGWAREISREMLQEEAREAEENTAQDKQSSARTTENLLIVADSRLSLDRSSALHFARISLQYPATFYLPRFLYKLAETDRTAADNFYRQALAAYSDAPMEQFLYLSSYPFGRNREAGEMPVWAYYQVPSDFRPNPPLQRLFVQTLLRRARQIGIPEELSRGNRLPEAAQIWIALARLEPQIKPVA